MQPNDGRFEYNQATRTREEKKMETIIFDGAPCPASYLGDGVYVIFDGFGYWLHANHHEHPTDRIYLEPEVFEALVRFREILLEMGREEKGGRK